MVGKVKKPSQRLNTFKEHTHIKKTTAKGNFFLTLQWNFFLTLQWNKKGDTLSILNSNLKYLWVKWIDYIKTPFKTFLHEKTKQGTIQITYM